MEPIERTHLIQRDRGNSDMLDFKTATTKVTIKGRELKQENRSNRNRTEMT
jgi:hypothetical protein